MPDYAFTSFVKENRPLSVELWRRAGALGDRIARATGFEDLEAFEENSVADTVLQLGIEAPRMGGPRLASEREGGTRWNAERTVAIPTRRFYVAVQVFGDTGLAGYWPDSAWAGPRSSGRGSVKELGGLDSLTSLSDEAASRYLRAGEIWEIGADEEPSEGRPGIYSLYTYFDLTLEEEEAVAHGDLDLTQIVRDRQDLIAPIMTAIAEQIQSFVQTALPEALLVRAAAKRRELANRQRVRDSLSFPVEWKASEPALEDSPTHEPPPSPEPDLELASADSDEVPLNPRSRLSRATYADVLFSLHHWANAVERYPAAFGVLSEDRISDLLAATWNATLPGAHREVYSRGGKSDIFVQADVLDPGRGPAKVFICEAKWATAHDVIRGALDPQLFGYLNVHDTSAVLLVLMSQQDFDRARVTYLGVLESVDGHRGTTDGPVDDWPLLEFVRDSRRVTICAAFVHLHVPGLGATTK